jgi:hypothetical protein
LHGVPACEKAVGGMSATQLREQATAIAADTPDVEWRVHHDSLASALVAALSDLTVIEPKNNADMGSFKVRYADLASLVKLTRKQLAGHGLVVLTPLCHLNDSPAVQVTIIHEGGESLTFGPFPFQHGRDAQATGSWVTYMRRYALVAALGMAAGDDDDGASAQPRQAEPPRTVSPKALAKSALLALLDGDKTKAAEAWTGIEGDSVDWSADPDPAAYLEHRYELWVNEQPDADAGGGS